MRTWKAYGAGLAALVFLAPAVLAQAPPTPAPPGLPAAPAAPAAAGAAPTAPAVPARGNIFDFFCPRPDQKDAWKKCFCDSQFGKLFNNALKPAQLFSGGLVESCCPPGPTAAEMAMEPDSAQGAAAQIQAQEAQAKARRAAVRYLGTVDCHWFPEAQAGMISALRTDTNECVRWEAAMAMGTGCCCTKPILEALMIAASGSDKDHNPSENSERVKAAAMWSLQRCLCRCGDCAADLTGEPPGAPGQPEKPERGEPLPPAPPTGPLTRTLSPYYEQVRDESMARVVGEARQVVARFGARSRRDVPPLTGNQSVFDLLTKAGNASAAPAAAPITPAVVLTPPVQRVEPTAVVPAPPPPPQMVTLAPPPPPQLVAVAPPPPPAVVQPAAPPPAAPPPTGKRDLFHIFLNATDTPAPPARTARGASAEPTPRATLSIAEQ